MGIFNILGVPLGWLLHFIYQFIPNYFISIFLFTVLVRAITFPLSLKSQKSQADRAKLAPRLERLQKKYGQDKQKLQQKQMELYEKEGVSLTGGCLPMLVQMVVLFGIISVIYKPLTHLQRIPTAVVNTAITAVTNPKDDAGNEIPTENKITSADAAESSYYRELRMLKVLSANRDEVIAAIDAMDPADRGGLSGADYYAQMQEIRQNFDFFGRTMLDNPWSGFGDINILWLIPLISGLTALASSLISMRYTQMAMSGEKQPGQGCSNVMLLVFMPAFSLFITFSVPGGVGIYWICSNIIAVGQTVLLNKIYNPAKIRAQAEKEYEERRRKKAEDKKRLKEARLREEEEARRQAQEEAEAAERARAEASKKKPVQATKNPNKLKKKAAGEAKSQEKTEPSADEKPSDDSVSSGEDGTLPDAPEPKERDRSDEAQSKEEK